MATKGTYSAYSQMKPIQEDFGNIGLQAGEAALKLREKKLQDDLLAEKKAAAQRQAAKEAREALAKDADDLYNATKDFDQVQNHDFDNPMVLYQISEGKKKISELSDEYLLPTTSSARKLEIKREIYFMDKANEDYNTWGTELKKSISALTQRDKDGNLVYDDELNSSVAVRNAALFSGLNEFKETDKEGVFKSSNGLVEITSKGGLNYDAKVFDKSGKVLYNGSKEGLPTFLSQGLTPMQDLSKQYDIAKDVKLDEKMGYYIDNNGVRVNTSFNPKSSAISKYESLFEDTFGLPNEDGSYDNLMLRKMSMSKTKKIKDVKTGEFKEIPMSYDELKKDWAKGAYDKFGKKEQSLTNMPTDGGGSGKKARIEENADFVERFVGAEDSAVKQMAGKQFKGIIYSDDETEITNPNITETKRYGDLMLLKGKSGDKKGQILLDLTNRSNLDQILLTATEASNPMFGKPVMNDVLKAVNIPNIKLYEGEMGVDTRKLLTNTITTLDSLEYKKGKAPDEPEVEKAISRVIAGLNDMGYDIDDLDTGDYGGTNELDIKDRNGNIVIAVRGDKGNFEQFKSNLVDELHKFLRVPPTATKAIVEPIKKEVKQSGTKPKIIPNAFK